MEMKAPCLPIAGKIVNARESSSNHFVAGVSGVIGVDLKQHVRTSSCPIPAAVNEVSTLKLKAEG